MERKEFAQNLIDFIDKSTDSYTAVDEIVKILEKDYFKRLDLTEVWEIEPHGKYYFTINSSSVTAFTVDTDDLINRGFRIIGAHCDSPQFMLKPGKALKGEDCYIRLNTEPYGSMIVSTWLDRPLGISGRVFLKGETPFTPIERVINFDRPMCIIPNQAIHMNRNINKGHEYDLQKEMLALISLNDKEFLTESYIKNLIEDELGIKANDILDYELFLYEYDRGSILGADDEFISCGRLDNLAMVHAGLNALMDADESKGISLLTIFDNEEVGSMSRQGADSNILLNTLERIANSMGLTRTEFLTTLEKSFMISADMAHAVHPAFPENHDPGNRPIMGKGPVIKMSAAKKYSSDGYSASVFTSLCDRVGVNCQRFVNKSGALGGSTIGPIAASHLGIKSVDVGNAILSMHSIRELGSTDDHIDMYKVFKEFYEINYDTYESDAHR